VLNSNILRCRNGIIRPVAFTATSPSTYTTLDEHHSKTSLSGMEWLRAKKPISSENSAMLIAPSSGRPALGLKPTLRTSQPACSHPIAQGDA
jgi:hypothetical protein